MKEYLRRSRICLWSVLSAFTMTALACAPQAAPAPVAPAAPAVTQAPAPAPASAPAPLSAEEAAWAKVVEGARKEGPLIVYTFGFTGDTALAVARAFKQRYGLTVEFVSGRSPAIVERLRTEYRANQVVASLAEGGGPRLMLLKEFGLTETLLPLPALKDKDAFKGDILLYDPEGHLLVYTLSLFTPIANTRLVKPEEEPRSWFDMLEPKWKGKILTADPVQDQQNYQLYAIMTNHNALPTSYFDRLGQQELFFVIGGPADTVRAVAKGDRHLAVPGTSSGAISVIQAGGPIKLLTMKEGFAISATPFAYMKNAPQPNSARVFMNWLLSPEGMRIYAESALTYSFRKDVPDAAPPNASVDWSKAVYPTLKDFKDIDKIWNEQLMVKILKK